MGDCVWGRHHRWLVCAVLVALWPPGRQVIRPDFARFRNLFFMHGSKRVFRRKATCFRQGLTVPFPADKRRGFVVSTGLPWRSSNHFGLEGPTTRATAALLHRRFFSVDQRGQVRDDSGCHFCAEIGLSNERGRTSLRQGSRDRSADTFLKVLDGHADYRAGMQARDGGHIDPALRYRRWPMVPADVAFVRAP
jgi:hypothetical protein